MMRPAPIRYTPGPWHVSPKYVVGPRSSEDNQSNGMIMPVADVYGDNRQADAVLIAAAPDLLEALTALVAAYEAHEPRRHHQPHALFIARAAISDAEGTPDLDARMRKGADEFAAILKGNA